MDVRRRVERPREVLRGALHLREGPRPPGSPLPHHPTLTHHNTCESLTSAPSNTICILLGYAGFGYYGCSADAPYCRKKTLGAIIQGDRLNQPGILRFRVVRDGDDNDPIVRPCLTVGAGADGGDFSFSMVF